jgi:hypothetical protein
VYDFNSKYISSQTRIAPRQADYWYLAEDGHAGKKTNKKRLGEAYLSWRIYFLLKKRFLWRSRILPCDL